MRLHRLLRQMLFTIAASGAAIGGALAQPATEHDLKAAFIYNFVQFTQWPEGALKGGTINLCVSRGTILHMALEPIAGKTAHGKIVALTPFQNEAVTGCHVLVAESDDRNKLGQLRRLMADGPVLTITDDPELMREGFMIGMLVESRRIAFIVDNTRATGARLTISSRLLRLARSVQ